MEDAFDFGDGVGVEEGLVSIADDQFGFCAVEVTARVGNDAVVTRSRRAGVYLADNACERELREECLPGPSAGLEHAAKCASAQRFGLPGDLGNRSAEIRGQQIRAPFRRDRIAAIR